MSEKNLRLVLFIIFAIFCVIVFMYIDTENLHNFFLENRKFAYILYIFAFLILPIFLFPVPILVIASGGVFGFYEAVFLTIISAMLNLSLMYFIARFFAKDYFYNLILKKAKLKKIKEQFLEKNEIILIFTLRLIPFVPYNALNYICGFLKIGFLNYLIASFLGIIPASFVLVYFGESLKKGSSFEFYLSLILVALLIILPLYLQKFLKRKKWL